MKQENIKADAVIIEDLSNSIFKCQLEESGFDVTCTISGKIRMNNIRLIVGDRVQIELSVYDLTHGRIVYRYRPGETAGNKDQNNNNDKKKKKNNKPYKK